MGQRTSDASRASGRGSRRTRGGPGRHNLGPGQLRGPCAATRICLGCNRPFRSRGPWNRFCGRCHTEQADEPGDDARRYHIPREWPASVVNDVDEI